MRCAFAFVFPSPPGLFSLSITGGVSDLERRPFDDIVRLLLVVSEAGQSVLDEAKEDDLLRNGAKRGRRRLRRAEALSGH
jgi:hypothetical protein